MNVRAFKSFLIVGCLVAILVLSKVLSIGGPGMAAQNAEKFFQGVQLDLAIAIETRSPEAVKNVLSTGARPNSEGANGVTPLAFAASISDNAPVIELLLQAGADPNKLDASAHTPVTLAILAAHPRDGSADLSNIRALLGNGGNAESVFPNGDPALVWTIGQNSPELLKLLLEAGADPNAAARAGEPAIVHAALGKYWDAVRVLIEGGAEWRAVHNGFSMPNAAEKPGVGEKTALYTDWREVRTFLEGQGMQLPAPTPKALGFASGVLTNDGIVTDGR